MPLVKQEMPTLSEHLSSPPVFCAVCVTRPLVLFICFVDGCLYFCTFSFAIVLSVLLRYTDSDYPFGIFKLFLYGSNFLVILCYGSVIVAIVIVAVVDFRLWHKYFPYNNFCSNWTIPMKFSTQQTLAQNKVWD